MIFFKEYHEKRKAEFIENVSDEIKDLLNKKQKISVDTWKKMRLNSYERRLLVHLWDDDLLLYQIQYSFDQEVKPLYEFDLPTSYSDAILREYMPELIKRIKHKEKKCH